MKHHGLNYFKSFWNMIDLISISLNFALMICAFVEIDEPTYVAISAVAIIIIWLRAFYFGRIFI